MVVTNQGSANYLIDGDADPALTLVRGCTYTFAVNTLGHPFYIKSISGAGTDNAFDDGVTGNGTTVGAVTFEVPDDAPDELFYNCANHAAMNGTIAIVGD